MINRYRATTGVIARWMNVIGESRRKDSAGSSATLKVGDGSTPTGSSAATSNRRQPSFLSSLWTWPEKIWDRCGSWLPDGAMHHDPNAYHKSVIT